MDYMHQRYYSPVLARFVSVDPVGGTVGSSQSWNRYSYVRNNPIAFIDPSGMEIQLTMDATDQNQFIEELQQATGLVLEVSDGEMVVSGELTDSDGNQIGSSVAREALTSLIDAENVFSIQGVNADPNVWGAQQQGNTVTLDFTDLAMMQPGANGSATQNSAMIGLHELLHTVGMVDPGRITLSNYPTATGETVDTMNYIRRQLGLPQRLQYAPESSSGRMYIPFENGPLFPPPKAYCGTISVN